VKNSIRVGIIGDFNPQYEPHVATDAGLRHAAEALTLQCDTIWLPTPSLQGEEGAIELRKVDALFCSPGSPYASMEGALSAIRFAREEHVPFLGTCGGFQHAIVEYARNVVGIEGAEHEETAKPGSLMVVHKLACSLAGQTHQVHIVPGTLAYSAYNKGKAVERFFCSYGLNPAYDQILSGGQMILSGKDDLGEARIIELSNHPFFMATLYVPQVLSTPDHPHPLLVKYLAVASKDWRTFSDKSPQV
jgi:CTP synthase (UTP-ammonia lyase)